MATRDKYNFTQQTILWGTINYNDVPSYSATSVGTTGNAYLVRNFLKQFFPFLDLSVKKTAGGSVNVAIQNFTVKFNFTEGGIFKEFVLNSKSLEDVLEPLFEGQGFDGMTDSTYSIPLPPMYNDEGQDVGYGYGYLFVRNENVEGEYLVNLDNLMFVNKVSFDVPPNSNLNYKSNLFTIPKKTIDYIKSNGVIPTANIPQGIYPTPTTNQSDLVTLEKGDSKVSLTTLEQEIIDFLAENNSGVELITIRNFFLANKNYVDSDVNRAISNLLLKDLLDNQKSTNRGLLYYVTTKGKSYITPKKSLTSLKEFILDFLEKKKDAKGASKSLIEETVSEYNINNYSQNDITTALKELVDEGLLGTSNVYGIEVYQILPKGKNRKTSVQDSSDSLKDPKQIIFDSENKSTLNVGQIAASDFISKNISILTDMSKDDPELFDGLSAGIRLILSLTKDDTGQLEPFKPLENLQQLDDQLKEEDFDLSEVDLEELDLTGLEDDLELNDDELGDFDLTEFNELADFVESELMPSASQDDRDYAILKTVQLQELSKKPISTKQVLESVNFNNQQKYTSQEIDILQGKDFLFRSNGIYVTTKGEKFIDEYELKNKQVETVLPAVDSLTPTTLEILKILYITNSKLTADNIKNDLSMQNITLPHKAVFNRLIELRDLQLVEEINSASSGIIWQITLEGEKYITELAKSSGKASATDIENISEYLKKSSGKQISLSPTDIMLKERQEKAQKTGDGLDYDYYLIASILNQSVNMMITAGDVTAILQSSFNKKPKWDENEILYKLRVLTSLGMALTDVQNSVDYFEISEFGEDVVKYLIEQENKGLYPNARKLFESKPTQQTVASRPSPTESATLNPIGTIKQGNDGNNWQVRENKSGVKRWVKL